MNICLIPARGGSKRIPRKNVRPFLGKPLIVRSIETALSSELFVRVIVSTDDEDIARIARRHRAEVPFLRPSELADDQATTAQVIGHAIEWLRTHSVDCTDLCCLYATAPLTRAEDLREAHRILREHQAPVVFPVTTFEFPVHRALTIDERGMLKMMWPEYETTRSQDVPQAYHDAGQFYWVDVERFRADPRLYAPEARPLVLPRYRVQDIDTEEDFRQAELMYRHLEEKA